MPASVGLVSVGIFLVMALFADPGRSATEPNIRIGFQEVDAPVAQLLAQILSTPRMYNVSLIRVPSWEPTKYVKTLTEERNLFLLDSPTRAGIINAATKAVGSAGSVPGPTIHAVTLSSYGDKVVDNTTAARKTWARKVVSAGVTEFQVGQSKLLFGAMGLRCIDQTPTAADSLKCRRNDYWDQPDYLVDRRDGTEAFFVWGYKCEDNVRRVHQLRPDEFRLIAIPAGMVGRLRERSQLPYVPDQMNVRDCAQQSLTPINVATGTLLYTVQQSTRSPDPRLAAFIADQTGRFLLRSFQRDDLVAALGAMDSLVPLLPSDAEVYAKLGLLRR